MGKTNRDKKKFDIPKTLNPEAHIKAAEGSRRPSPSKTKRPQTNKRQSIRNGW
jgi:hypothetical protein